MSEEGVGEGGRRVILVGGPKLNVTEKGDVVAKRRWDAGDDVDCVPSTMPRLDAKRIVGALPQIVRVRASWRRPVHKIAIQYAPPPPKAQPGLCLLRLPVVLAVINS